MVPGVLLDIANFRIFDLYGKIFILPTFRSYRMLSFIILGRNEAANLERCIRSVLSSLVHWNISAYEIIYVDSRSTDRSIEIVKQFPRIKIFYVTGECSAAVSRNIGAAEAIGTTLFFVDADMELSSTFMDGVFNIDGSLKYDVITGQVVV